MKYFLFIASLLFLYAPEAHSQASSFPRDTSYTARSAYNKYIKTYSHITISRSKYSGELKLYTNLPYKDVGYRELSLDIFTPADSGEKSNPAVLMVHGGGWISGDKSLLHPLAREIAESGYTTITIEYRLSPEALYPAAVYDINTALRWVKDHSAEYGIDPEKVAVLGTSAGGQLAALTGTTSHLALFNDPEDTSSITTKVKAIVDVDGVLAFIHPVSEEGRVASLWLDGDKEEARDTWTEASALTYAGKDTPPVLFLGSSNPRFLAGRKDMIQIMDKEGIYHESYILEDAPHSFWLFNPWFEPTVGHIIDFLDKVLK